MIILFLLGLWGSNVECLQLPPNEKAYWEDMVPIFEDMLVDSYGSRAREFAPWILEAADHYGVDAVTLSRLIFKESSFRTNVRSRSGAVGPAQIKPKYWETFCSAHDIHDAEGNVKCSAQILAHLEGEFGSLRKAVSYYNAGRGRASSAYVEYIVN